MAEAVLLFLIHTPINSKALLCNTAAAGRRPDSEAAIYLSGDVNFKPPANQRPTPIVPTQAHTVSAACSLHGL